MFGLGSILLDYSVLVTYLVGDSWELYSHRCLLAPVLFFLGGGGKQIILSGKK